MQDWTEMRVKDGCGCRSKSQDGTFECIVYPDMKTKERETSGWLRIVDAQITLYVTSP